MKANNLRKALSATLAAAMLSFIACDKNAPFTPDSAKNGRSEIKILKVMHPRLGKVFENSKWIGSMGGKIEVGDEEHGISKIYFPMKAVSSPVFLTFWWESSGFLEGGADFSPHGTTFNRQVKIELSYKDADLSGVNEDDLRIYYYHEDTGVWEIIGDQVNKNRKTVTGYTTHFSRYAIGAE